MQKLSAPLTETRPDFIDSIIVLYFNERTPTNMIRKDTNIIIKNKGCSRGFAIPETNLTSV